MATAPSELFLVLFCLVTIAFFSGMEIAFLSASRLRIELKGKNGGWGGRWMAWYTKRPTEFISTVLVATNLALVVYGMYMSEILTRMFHPLGLGNVTEFLLITIVSTLVVLVTAEFLPKTLFRLHADSLLFTLAAPFRLAHLLLWPLIQLTRSLSSGLLRLFTKQKVGEEPPVFTKVDLDNYLTSLEKNEGTEESEIDTEAFKNALEFSDVRVNDFLVPRRDMVALDINASIAELRERFVETSLSRIMVYRIGEAEDAPQDPLDAIMGFVHHSDLFYQPERIRDIVHPVLIVSETLQAQELLRRFIQEKRSVALVVDEFGGTAGMATIEDVVEEIFGEIEDEFDTDDASAIQLGPNHYRFSARLEVDYLNQKYDLNIPEGDYTTLGGFVIFCTEKIPSEGESLRSGPFEFTITQAEGARLEELELRIHALEN
ncbi:MAG: hemolysin family protein [Bacteroidia bacterium]